MAGLTVGPDWPRTITVYVGVLVQLLMVPAFMWTGIPGLGDKPRGQLPTATANLS